LGLYCLHPFLNYQVETHVTKIFQNEIISTYASIIIVILLSYAVAMALKTYYLKEEVIM